MENETPFAKPEEKKPLPITERIKELEKKQTDSIDWTLNDFKELSSLREKMKTNTSLTPAHREALRRQGLAGTGQEPPLTHEEIRLIQEANDLL